MELEFLSLSDINFILESLEHSRYKFETYQEYPTPEYKQQRLFEVAEVTKKVKELKRNLKNNH